MNIPARHSLSDAGQRERCGPFKLHPISGGASANVWFPSKERMTFV